MHSDVSAHAPQPPSVGVTEQDWLVNAPESTPLAHVRTWDAQLPPQATDEFWYAVTLAPSAMALPPQGEAHATGGRVQPTLCVASPAQAAPPQAGAGLSQARCWVFIPLAAHTDVSAHALHPPSVGVTEQVWRVYAPERTPLAHVRVCDVQVPPLVSNQFAVGPRIQARPPNHTSMTVATIGNSRI